MEPDLAGRLRSETRLLHQQAESSPFMVRLVAGRTSRAAYCLLLRNLQPIYQSLEAGAARLAWNPALARLFDGDLLRLAVLEADLRFLHGPHWEGQLPLVPAADAYRRRLDGFGPGQAHLLAAHAYVRYLGDLAGGQQLRAIVARALELRDEDGTAFYSFGAQGDVHRLVQAFRSALNRCSDGPAESGQIVAEAKLAFRMHHGLFAELEQALPQTSSGTSGASR